MALDVHLKESTYHIVSMVKSIDFTVRLLSECKIAANAIRELDQLRGRLVEQIGDDVIQIVKAMDC